MTAKEIFESLDLSQLPKDAADKFRKVEKATKGFTIESEKVNTFMRGAYKKIKENKPTALKNLKVEEKIIKKEVKKGETTQVVEDLEYKVKGTKKVSKKTPTPSKPKRSGETAMERARKIRKKDEAWKDALARAQKELKAETTEAKKDAEKVVSTTSQALKNLEKMIQNDPKLKGYPRTYGNQSKRIDANKDAKIKAKPAGKRVSKKGHKNQYGTSKGGRVYWENRDNRSDRYAPNFPNKVFLEMGGETDDLGFPTGHTFLVVEVSPDGTKNLIKSTTDYMTALMSSAVTRGRKTNKENRVVIVDKEDKKVIHEAFEAGGEITITPTQIVNNPDYLVGTTTMTELFEAGGVTAYQEGGEVFVTPSSLINAGSADYVAGSNTMSNMFESGGDVNYSQGDMYDILDEAYSMAEDLKDESTAAYIEKILDRMDNGDTLPQYDFRDILEEISYTASKNSGDENDLTNYVEKFESGGVVYLYYGGEQPDETIEAANENEAENIAMKMGAEHYDFVAQMEKGGRILTTRERYILELKGLAQGLRPAAIDKFIDENKLTDEEILNLVIGLGRKQISYSDFVTAIVGNKDNEKFKNLMAFIKSDKALRMAKGGSVGLNWLDNQDEVEVKIGGKTILFDVIEFNDKYVFDPATEQDEDKVDDLEEKNEDAVVNGLSSYLRKKVKGVAFSNDENHGGAGYAFKIDGKMQTGGTIDDVGNPTDPNVLKEMEIYIKKEIPKLDEDRFFTDGMKRKEAKRMFYQKYGYGAYNPRFSFFEKGGYVVVGDKDGFWTITSTPSSEKKAKELLESTTFPRGEKGKIVSVAEAMSHKKVIGKEYLETGGTIVAADPSAAMEDLNQTYGYESVYEKGGRLGFDGLAKKVAKRYEGKAVKPKYQGEYGKTYSKEEAMEVGRKVAAKVYGQQQAKMEMGGQVTQPYSLINAGSADYVAGSNTMSNMFAKGGSLDGHGLQLGDKIVKDLGSVLKVTTKDGGMVYVDLASGYRGKDMPLPFEKGGAVGGMNIPNIAKKFGKTTADVFAQLQVGEKHEMEHTTDPKKARKIALDHLSGDLNYYTKLKKLGL